MRLLRIVPDDTKFDFMRFRRISFPVSAALSILAIVLYFTHGLNFGIDFQGGTLLEVQAKSGAADLQTMRNKLNYLTSRRAPISPQEFVAQVNPVLTGWVNYFRHTNASQAFRGLLVLKHAPFRRPRIA